MKEDCNARLLIYLLAHIVPEQVLPVVWCVCVWMNELNVYMCVCRFLLQTKETFILHTLHSWMSGGRTSMCTGYDTHCILCTGADDRAGDAPEQAESINILSIHSSKYSYSMYLQHVMYLFHHHCLLCDLEKCKMQTSGGSLWQVGFDQHPFSVMTTVIHIQYIYKYL